jgi:hypothetical protein
MTRRIVVAGLVSLLALAGLSACTPFSPFRPKPDLPCTLEEDLPASLFAFEAPETATASVPFSVVAWVSVSGDTYGFQVPLPETFKADVDATAKTITLSGLMRTDVPNPAAQCPLPMGMPAPKGATMSIRVSAPAGTYTLRIPDATFAPQKPINPPSPGDPVPYGYPEARATQSIVIQEPSS